MSGARLLLVALLAGGVAFGQVAPIGTSSVGGAVKGIVSNGINGMTSQQFHMLADAGAAAGGETVKRSLQWGKVVRYGAGGLATAAVAGTLIYAGLEWFYNEAQEAANPELDSWYAATGGTPSGGAPQPEFDYTWMGDNKIHFATNLQVLRDYAVAAGVPDASYALQVYLGYGYGPSTGGQWHAVAAGAGTTLSGPYESSSAATNTARLLLADWIAAEGGTISGAQQSLSDLMTANPNAESALRNDVLPAYIDSRTADANTFPSTYADPFGDGAVVLDPAPNVNQWYDNPYANPQLDTDGDGFKDWEETEAQTDPADVNDKPTVVPTPGEATDTDGDGIPDEFDPCVYQASNECADPEPIDTDDLAREVTLQGAASTLGDIRANTEASTGQAAPATMTGTAWDHVLGEIESSFDTWWATAQTKMPFAMSPWVPSSATVSGAGDCQAIPMSILGTTQDVGLCNTPIDTFMSTVFRGLVLAVAMFAGYLSLATLMAKAGS